MSHDVYQSTNRADLGALVSIITPAYRCASVVDQTIKSVLAQTYPHWEMLIAEDCSPDNTREVVEHWSEIDPRIKLIKLESNGGPALARNAALERARGRWIAFLDSDDLWLPQKLEQCLDFARKQDVAFIYTGFRRIPSTGGEPGRYIGVPETLNYRQLLGNTAIATSTVMLDTARTGTIRMRKTYYDDFDCWLQVLKKGITAHGLNEDLMRYRLMEKSVSRNKRKSALKVWQAYRELERLSIPFSVWYFIQYAIRGVLKYL
jgi:teichuronic acid biosynthesis glycosyltransferase TuaG